MASLSMRVTPPVSLRHGVRCVPASGVAVEDVLVAVGEEIGNENITSASRMNKAVVVFVKEEVHVGRLITNGIVVSGEFIIVSPLVAPTTKVTVSNVPPFIPNEEIERGLSRYGKFASAMKALPLGCKNESLKHVMSFRRQVFMFLNEPSIDVSFRVMHEGKAYMIYANTGSMKCFVCGDVSHKRLMCPHKVGVSGENASENAGPSAVGVGENASENAGPSAAGGGENAIESALPSTVEEREDHSGKPAESVINDSHTEEAGAEPEAGENSVTKNDVSERGDTKMESVDLLKSQENCETEMKDDDTFSEVSDVGSQIERDVYTLKEINDFLDMTFGKAFDVTDFFPDPEKFIASVLLFQRTVSYEALDKKKRFRLKKMVTKLRKDKVVSQRHQNV